MFWKSLRHTKEEMLYFVFTLTPLALRLTSAEKIEGTCEYSTTLTMKSDYIFWKLNDETVWQKQPTIAIYVENNYFLFIYLFICFKANMEYFVKTKIGEVVKTWQKYLFRVFLALLGLTLNKTWQNEGGLVCPYN